MQSFSQSKKQETIVEGRREREEKITKPKIYIFSKTQPIKSKRRICNPSQKNNTQFGATPLAPRDGKRDEY